MAGTALCGSARGGAALERIAVATLTALGAVHAAGMVHRDFKPGNVLLGPDGIQRYRDVLSLASQWEPTRRYAIAGPLGLGPQLYAVQAIVVVVAVVAAWRQRNMGPARPIATGIFASLLFTPYVGFQDFAMLVIAGWLLIRSGATSVQVALMVVGYALLELALVVLAVPILLAEFLLLGSLLWPVGSTGAKDAYRPASIQLLGDKRA